MKTEFQWFYCLSCKKRLICKKLNKSNTRMGKITRKTIKQREKHGY